MGQFLQMAALPSQSEAAAGPEAEALLMTEALRNFDRVVCVLADDVGRIKGTTLRRKVEDLKMLSEILRLQMLLGRARSESEDVAQKMLVLARQMQRLAATSRLPPKVIYMVHLVHEIARIAARELSELDGD